MVTLGTSTAVNPKLLIEEYNSASYVQGELSMKKGDFGGISKYIFQYNPVDWSDEKSANWITHTAPGIDKPKSEWLNSELKTFDLNLVATDYLDGPPVGFDNLIDVQDWFEYITTPTESTGFPPLLELSMGELYKGSVVVGRKRIRTIKTYENLLPKIISIFVALREYNE